MRTFLTCLLLVAGLVVAGRSSAAGVNFSWNACTSEGGVQNKTFACNTNAGAVVMYGSFTLTTDQSHFIGIEATVDVHAEGASLPDWWQFLNASACRQSAMTAAFTFSGDPGTSCHDPWAGLGTGAVAAYHTFWTTPPVPSGNENEAQVLLVAAVPSTSPQHLVGGTEYYGFKLSMSLASTVGSGACGGCSTPVCLTLSKLTAVQSDNSQEALTQPVTANLVTWQSPASCPGAGAAQNITWGQVRSVLR